MLLASLKFHEIIDEETCDIINLPRFEADRVSLNASQKPSCDFKFEPSGCNLVVIFLQNFFVQCTTIIFLEFSSVGNIKKLKECFCKSQNVRGCIENQNK